jgi:hypothetical protein
VPESISRAKFKTVNAAVGDSFTFVNKLMRHRDGLGQSYSVSPRFVRKTTGIRMWNVFAIRFGA